MESGEWIEGKQGAGNKKKIRRDVAAGNMIGYDPVAVEQSSSASTVPGHAGCHRAPAVSLPVPDRTVPTDELACANLDGKFSVILHRNRLQTVRLAARFLLHLTKNFLANLYTSNESSGTTHLHFIHSSHSTLHSSLFTHPLNPSIP